MALNSPLHALASLKATLCRGNGAVQSLVKARQGIKLFYRSLIGFLSHSNLHAIVYSLSLLASTTFH